MEQKLDAVVLVIGGLGLLETNTGPHPDVQAAGACLYTWIFLWLCKWWIIGFHFAELQFVSLHLFQSKGEHLFLLPSCSLHPDKETTGNIFQVMVFC